MEAPASWVLFSTPPPSWGSWVLYPGCCRFSGSQLPREFFGLCVGSCCGSGLGRDEALGQGSQHTHVHTGEVGSPGPCQLLPTQHPSCKDSMPIFREPDACKLQGLRRLETRRRSGQRAGTWFILSPVGWRTISFCQVKSCLFLGCSASDLG